MPAIPLAAITDDGVRDRMSQDRAAYLDDRFDESVQLSVDVYLGLVRDNPNALEGTRVDPTSRFGRWPDYGITLADAGTTSVLAVSDGRSHSMASAVCYCEYILEAVVLAENRARTAV